MDIVRDFISPGEDQTPAETAASQRAVEVTLDYRGRPQGKPTKSRDEHSNLALELALRDTADEGIKSKAAETLSAMNAPDAIILLGELSEVERRIWLQAELEGKARKSVLDAFPH